MQPAALAEPPASMGTPSAVPELRDSLDIPVEAADARLERGHVCTTATLSQLLILNDFRDLHRLQGLSDSQIVSRGLYIYDYYW